MVTTISFTCGFGGAVLCFKEKKKREPAVADWRPQAQQELIRIRQSLTTASPDAVVSDCSRLARRLALAALPREDVASLHGQAWMSKLDELSESNAFSDGDGQLLLTGPYQMKPGTVADEAQLMKLELLVTELDGLFQTISGASA